MIAFSDSAQVSGLLRVRLYDAESGALRRDSQHPNKITEYGVNALRDGSWPNVSHFALGSGTSTPALADTALDTEEYRDTFTTSDLSVDYTADFQLVLGALTGNGVTYTEAGLFDASSGGNLFCRLIFTGDDAVVKTSDLVAQFDYSITFANG